MTPTAYLAQHRLFDQVPALASDYSVPDFCSLSLDRTCVAPPEVEANAWFGPKGTVSTAHFDPKHNLLCQAVGMKLVMLWSPEDGATALYPRDDELRNTSSIDCDMDPEEGGLSAAEASTFPLFNDAPCRTCILRPGECLYIPPRWWHFCKSKDVSFSVSFWWQ